MNNRLILICPFSRMEMFVREHLGDDVFFLTSTAAIFHFDDSENMDELKSFIERERITEVIILNDTSCRFINKVIKNDNRLDLPVEKILLKIFKENYAEIMEKKLFIEQLEMLAMFNVRRQARELYESKLFQHNFSNEIKLSGIVTTKSTNRIKIIKTIE